VIAPQVALKMLLACDSRADARPSRITLGGAVEIELVEQDGLFRGLGSVACGGAQLRSPARPMFVDIRNPWGVQLCNFRLAEREEVGEGVD
jgi:hypothetical protein